MQRLGIINDIEYLKVELEKYFSEFCNYIAMISTYYVVLLVRRQASGA